MKKTLLIAAMASAALVSCSKDQVVEVQQDEIKFSVVADNATKAAHVYSTTYHMDAFTVAADYNSKVYITGDEMSVTSVSNVTNTDPTVKRYWPAVSETKPVTFYAVADGDFVTSPARVADAVPTVSYTVEETVASQKDLLYAATKVTEKGSGSVTLNFRHALSLIEFKAKCTNKNLKVVVTGVKVGNVENTGVFTFPKDNQNKMIATDGNITENPDDVGKDNPTGVGTWNNTVASTNYYTVEFDAVNVIRQDPEVVQPLTYRNYSAGTYDNATPANNSAKSMILLPQTLNNPWDPSTGNLTSGSYLGVQCCIYNVENGVETLLYGTDNGDETFTGKWAYMPLGAVSSSPVWEPGKKYVYTFDFGTGNGGYDDTGNPVLTPIAYTLTIDDFDAFDPDAGDGNETIDTEMEME